ncbi:hypothetical protein Y032_0027g1556 [Ancylostoma ceylanicum]|uniref:Uncharacterized protein n=1 Tax=Ancylostoma ceylanicum TaxID=53326 RepID=A0A016USV6_9BILA|nr:hypothetical protein Y032_0027g1556 [Ancylostoma ceylanicum]
MLFTTYTLNLQLKLVSVGVMVIVCASLSILCVVTWLLRCRRDQLRQKGEQERQRDVDAYKDKQVNKSFSKRAVADTVTEPKRAESVHSEHSKNGSQKEVASTNEEAMPGETLGQVVCIFPSEKEEDGSSVIALHVFQYEARVKQTYVSRPLERIKEESTPVRNKRLDTVSVTASFETLQRNDSKVNVFPADKMEEIDLNPGLNSVINLETI